MYRLFLLITFCLFLSSCDHGITEPKLSTNFPTSLSAIIQTNCLGGSCHSAPTINNSGLDLSSWDMMTKGSIFLNDVIPYNANKSHLFGHINTNASLGAIITPTMPLARNPLSTSDQKQIADWINLGAKSETGEVPYNDVTKKIYIANQAENMISVVDAATTRLIRVIPMGDTSIKFRPTVVTMTPDHTNLIVGMLGANGLVRKYDQTQYTVQGEFASNLSPQAIAITPDGKKGYITDNSSLTSSRFGTFDPQTMTMTIVISSPFIKQPYDVITTPDGKFAYMGGYRSDNILRIDTRTDSVLGNLPLGTDVEIPITADYVPQYQPIEIVLSPDAKRMYVPCLNSAEVVVLDLEHDSITKRIALPFSPRAAAITPDGKEVWVATWVNSIHIISTTSNEIIATVDSVSQSPHAMTFTPDGAYAYVACEYELGGGHHHSSASAATPSSVVAIDRITRKILSIVELPAFSVSVVAGFGK